MENSKLNEGKEMENANKLSFDRLLKSFGFDVNDENCSFRMIREGNDEQTKEKFRDNNLCELYQCVHIDYKLKCNYVFLFNAIKDSTKALFLGVYKVKGEADKTTLTEGYVNAKPSDNYYLLERQKGYEDLEQRVIIEWGKGALAWVQTECNKEIIEIKPKCFVYDFPGYLDFVLSFRELKQMILDNSDAYIIWKHKLSSVYGIYLILDTTTGKQYIGSASGKEGIWGKWKEYAENGHGDNVQLKDLLKENPDNVFHLQWTILRTLSSDLTKPEVDNYETKYKEKLGTKDFGLNSN